MRKPSLIGGFVLGLLASVMIAGLAAPDGLASSIRVDTIPGPTVTQVIGQKLHSSLPWYIVRGSGLVAAVALVLLMLSGIGQITGYTYRLFQPLTAWASHRALGLVFAVSVLLHIFGLLFDHFLPFTLAQLFIPWLSDYRPVHIFGVAFGSLWVAFGVIAFYLTFAVVVSSLIWTEKQPRRWKLLHFLSYVVIALVFIHALYLGTDVGQGWARVLWIGSAVVILVASIARLWRARTV